MEALARRILNKPIEVQVGGRSVVCSDVEQHVVKNMLFLSVSDYSEDRKHHELSLSFVAVVGD